MGLALVAKELSENLRVASKPHYIDFTTVAVYPNQKEIIADMTLKASSVFTDKVMRLEPFWKALVLN